MSRFAIVAFEGTNHGLNGVVDYAIADCDSLIEAENLAIHMSHSLMDIWSISGDIEEQLEIDVLDPMYNSMLINALEENVRYEVYLLSADAEAVDKDELLAELFHREDKFRRTWAAD